MAVTFGTKKPQIKASSWLPPQARKGNRSLCVFTFIKPYTAPLLPIFSLASSCLPRVDDKNL